MSGPFQPKTVQVPGLLTDDAFQEKLKQFSQAKGAEQKAAPPPNSAVEFADKINNDFLKPGVVPAMQKNPRLQAQDKAIDVRSDILSDVLPDASDSPGKTLLRSVLGPIGVFGEGGIADQFLFDPRERQAAADERLKEAQRQEQAINEHAMTRAKLRGMTDEQAAAMGFPVSPGGTSADDTADSIKRDGEQVVRAAANTMEKQKASTTPELQPTMPWWLNSVREGFKAAAGTPLSMAKGGIASWELTGGAIMNGGDLERSDMRAWVDTVEATLDKMMPGDKARSKDFVTQLSQGGGSMAAFMLGGYVGAAIGLPAGSVPAIMGALSQGAEGLEDAERFNAVGVQKYIAFIANAGLGLTEAAPIDRMFMRAEKATGGLVTRMLANTVASGLEEFIQEFGQAAGQDLVAKWTYDANRELDIAKWARAGAVGLLTGGLSGAALQTLQEAGVAADAPTGNPVDDAQREEAATLVIDVLQDRFDRMTAQPPVDVAMSAQEAADAVLSGDVPPGFVKTNPDGTFTEGEGSFADVAPAEGVVQGPGGTIPVNEAGKMELRHYSRQQLPEIDPAMRGTGPMVGDERARLAGPDAVDRSYFGAGRQPGLEEQRQLAADLRAASKQPQRAGELGNFSYPRHEAEQAAFRKNVEQKGYAPEAGLGDYRHIVEADPATIYNALEDPLDLRTKLDPELKPSERVTQYERLVRDAGFKGMYFAESTLGQTVVMFEKTKPVRVESDRFDLPLGEIATKDDLKELKREFFQQKGGWAILTGTQERLGDAASELNVKQNEKLRKELTRKGVQFEEVGGTYRGVDQGPSFLVFMPEREALDLASRYKQESILTRKGLEYGDGRLVPALPDKTVVGPEAKELDFYSTLPGGEAFSVGLDFGGTTDPDILAKTGDPVAPERQAQLMDQVPGLKNVLPYMTPDEQALVRKQNAQKLVDMVESLPSAEEMASVAFSGRAKRGWYQKSAEALLNIFGIEDAPRFSALLAALSPQTSVESNTINALNMWSNWIKAGRPTDAKTIKRLMGKSVQGGLGFNSVLDAWVNNTIEALSNPDVNAIVLSGPKVSSFMANLNSVVHEVTNDAWMANYANVDQNLFRANYRKLGDRKVGGKSMGYVAMSALVRRAAKIATDLTGETWTPAEIQETVWSWAKTLYEKSTDIGVSAEQLLAVGGMTAEDISNTPDFAALFVTGVYRNILERGGYDLSTVDASNQRTDGRDDRGRDPFSNEGLGVDKSAFDANLRRAAQRLDALRASRQGETGQPSAAEEAEVDDGRNQLPEWVTDDDIDAFATVAQQPLPDTAWGAVRFGDKIFWGGSHEAALRKMLTEVGIDENDAERIERIEKSVSFGSIYDGRFRGLAFDIRAHEFLKKEYGIADPEGYTGLLVGLRVRRGEAFEQAKDAEIEAARSRGAVGWYIPGRDTPDGKNQHGAIEPDNLAMAGGTSQARGPYKAEQTRPSQGVPTPQGQTGTSENGDLSLTKITRNFTKMIDLTLRQGRISMTAKDSFGNKQDVMGEYNRRQDVTRVRTMNDLSTIVHEGGHKVYFGASDPLKQFVAANDTKLMKVATDLYGGDTNIMPKATQVAEGFAEFFRVYTLNRKFAERKYAALTQGFDQLLTANDKQLKDGLDLIGQQFAAWLQLPSAQMVANMIVSGKQDEGIKAAVNELREAGFQTWFHEVARKTVEESVNRFASFDDLINTTLNIGQRNKGKAVDLKRADDPRALIRLAQNSGARANVQLSDGVMGYRSVASETRGLRDALLLSQGKRVDQNLSSIDPVRQRDFAAYLVALRGIDEYRRFDEGKIERPPVAATLGDLKLVVDEMQAKYPEFAEAGKIVHEYAMGLWKKAHDAGLMSDETYSDGLDRQFYAPLQRDMSDKKSTFGDGPLTGGNKLVKQFRGSDRDIIDPMDILMHKTFALEQIIARNDVLKTLASLADRAGKAGAMVERIPATQMIGRQFGVKEIARQLTKDENMTEADAVDLMTLLEASIKDEKTLALFRSEQASTLGENVVFFWENGKLAALQLADGDLGADVVNVVNGLGRENLPLFADLIAATSTAFRSSITLWPDFLVVNFIRDQMSAFILTDVGFKPFWTGLKGVGDELRQKGWAKQYNAAMGMMGGMNTAALHNARVNRDIGALRRKGYVASAFSDRTLLGAVRGMARVAELTETGSRLGIFRNAYNRAKADGLTDWEASIEASYTATDYMNFGLNGSKMLLFRRTIPFLNAQLQGLYKMMRTLGADEVRQRKGLRFVLSAYFKSTKNMDLSRTEKAALNTGRKAWVKMASLGLISAALHFLFEDDPDYQEAGEYLRTTGWVIPLGDGRLFYIPKPFELAVMANFTERAFEAASGDTTAKARFLRGLAMTMTPPTAPPALQSLVEYAANRDFFTGQEIIPSYMQALSPELQFNNYTTAFAKQIGEITGWSPMVIDHFMGSLGASAYKDMTGVWNAMDPARPEMDATDAPLTRRFVRDVRRGSSSSKDFWAQASTLNGTLRRAEVSYKRYLEAGNEPAANAFLDTLDEDSKAYALLNANFEAEYKRLNPFYRTRQVNTIVSAMRRELVTDLGVDDTAIKNSGDTIKLSRRQKNEIDTALSELSRREMRNTLIAMGAPGWNGKKPLRTDTTMDLIGAIDPRMREELERRIKKAKVYNADVVNEYWPEVKNRLLSDRENTFLKDVLAIAKATR